MESFVIDDKLYLFVANYKQYAGGSTITNSHIYIINSQTGLFEQHQTIDTQGAVIASYLELSANHYLLVANHYGPTHDVNSTLYQWNFDRNQFTEFAQLPSNGAYSSKLFSIDGILYAAIANYVESMEVKSMVWSFAGRRVYMGCFKDSGTDRAMTVTRDYADDLTIDVCIDYCIDQCTPYAGLQNGRRCRCGSETYSKHGHSPDTECNLDCPSNSQEKCGGEYRNSVYTTGISSVQSLPEPDTGSTGIDVFENDGETYLVTVNQFECMQNSTIYKWDNQINVFKIHQQVPVEHCPQSATIFKVGGEVFMILATPMNALADIAPMECEADVANYNASSPIFKLEGGMFVSYRTMTSTSGWEISFFERDGEYFLGQSNEIKHNDDSVADASVNIYQWV